MDSGQFMKPRLSVKEGDDEVLSSIIKSISDIEWVDDLSGLKQTEQQIVIKKFQKKVMTRLANEIKPIIKWQTEFRPDQTNRDSVDIYGIGDKFAVVIELDKFRADQVSKKFVSRMVILKSDPEQIYYVSLCYPGTKNMNKPECEKYFRYCSELARRMGSHYAGLIIEPAT